MREDTLTSTEALHLQTVFINIFAVYYVWGLLRFKAKILSITCFMGWKELFDVECRNTVRCLTECQTKLPEAGTVGPQCV